MKLSNIRSNKRSKKQGAGGISYHNNNYNNSKRKRFVFLSNIQFFWAAILYVLLLFGLPSISGFGTIGFSSYLTTGRRMIGMHLQTITRGYFRSSIMLQFSSPEQEEGKEYVIVEEDSISTAAANRNRQEIPEFNPSEKIEVRRKDKLNVGNPQILVKDKDLTVTDILLELAAIQQEGPQKYCILGSRYCSYLHQQIIELLAYALVLSGNHVFTSGAQGVNAAAVRGALRANQTNSLTVVLPQSLEKQDTESQELLKKVENLIAFPHRDEMSLEMASKLCNSFLLNQTDQLISFAFHESSTVIEAAEEARERKKLVTMLFLD